jgi:glycosyltransferase involved in cell wall biosynthesis
MSGDRVAIVVQRFHEKIVGGSETLARQYAELLSRYYGVDVLTSCALDYMTWKNEIPEGVEAGPGYSIIRFPAASERSGYWQRLDRLLHRGVDPKGFASSTEDKALLTRRLGGWPLALQEEYIRAQGPHCPGLYDYLAANGGNYRAVFFITYLYATAYFGSLAVDGRKSVFVPTFHDEPCAYFPAFGSVFERAAEVVYLTEAERRVVYAVQGCGKGEVAGMAIDFPGTPAVRKEDGPPFIIYTGRIDENKGCATLLEYFQRYKKRRPSELRLVLTGHKLMDIPSRDDIKFLGFVPESEKWTLLGNALGFVHLGCYESFSISALEAMASSTPVIVNRCCSVLAEHCGGSGAGFVTDGYDDFEKALDALSHSGGKARDAMGAKGREYVSSRYSREAVAGKLRRIVENISPDMPADSSVAHADLVETLKGRVEERVRSLKESGEPEGTARAMLAQAERRVLELGAEVHEKARVIEEMSRVIEDQVETIKSMARDNADKDKTISRLMNSYSWRITRPVRYFSQMAKRLAGKTRGNS